MHERDSHGAFAHRGRASFHRPMPHVSRSENAGHVGLEIIRMAVERPVIRQKGHLTADRDRLPDIPIRLLQCRPSPPNRCEATPPMQTKSQRVAKVCCSPVW